MDADALKALVLTKIGEGSVAPNEIAQAAGGDPAGPRPEWRAMLRAIEQAALELESEGRLIALRKGKPVPLADAKGVIRYAAPG